MKDESGIVTAVDKIDYSLNSNITLNTAGPPGAVGATGSYATSGTYTVTPSTTGVTFGPNYYTVPNVSTPNITWGTSATPVTSINSQLVINYNGTKIDVGQAITMLMERLCIIQPSFELHDKYPALREAYEAYKSLEALCKTGEKDE